MLSNYLEDTFAYTEFSTFCGTSLEPKLDMLQYVNCLHFVILR